MDYIKVIGLQADALETTIVGDANKKDFAEAAEYAETHNCPGTVWVALPCTCTMHGGK